MLTIIATRLIIMLFGVLYPAFSSYKALNRRDGYEQVRWMMYWIVFAIYIACESLTDIFLSWLPFYYEIKIIFVIWLLSPFTRGSSYLYRKLVHPTLQRHESDIDVYLNTASNRSCELLYDISHKGITYAAKTVFQTADNLRKCYSVGDLSQTGVDKDRVELRNQKRDGFTKNRSISLSANSSAFHDLSNTNFIPEEEVQSTSTLSSFSLVKSRHVPLPKTRKPATSTSDKNLHDVLSQQANKRALKGLYKVEENQRC